MHPIALQSFYDYVSSFYGCRDDAVYPLRFTIKEIKRATNEHIRRAGNSFQGDSVDREAVRDIIFEEWESAGKPIPEGW